MRTARKFRVVPDCPQPDGEPIRELVTGDGKHLVFGHEGYGCKPIAHLPHNPPANEATVIARVQSARTKAGQRAEPLSYEASLRWEAEQNRPRRVTVPDPN